MKKYTSILLLPVMAMMIAGLGACAKKKEPDTTAGKIIGKWKKIQYATDDNQNGIIDAEEITNQPSSIDDELFFASSQTGNETTTINKNKSEVTVLEFDWSVSENKLWIGYRANDTVTYSVVNINASNLIITTNTSRGLAWYSYAKQ
jgi:hypothetical protein